MAQGFVYILINPAVPGYVKVGKTTKAPEDRARELSAATGVATPFVVAYDAAFTDCDRAESYIHALLESRGISRTPDREFFAINLRAAIGIVMEAERNLKQIGGDEDSSDPSAASLDSDAGEETAVWLDILEQAEAYDYGHGDTIEDPDRAVALYRQAARLGAPDAYVRLAELSADQGDSDEGLRWLMRGAETGVIDCWAALGLVYMGENFHFELEPHPGNATKAWRRFFRTVDPSPNEPRASWLYSGLCHYIRLLAQGHQEAADTETIRIFTERFADALSKLDRVEKLPELRALVAAVL